MNGRPWRFVIVGCGRMGLAHARRLAAHPRAKLIGFFDAEQSLAERLQARVESDGVVFRTFQDAMAAAADAVVIATPTPCHHDQITAAVQAGRHVLAEKPLSGDRSEILSLIALAAAHPRQHCLLGYQRRFWRNYQFLKEQIQSAGWGAIRSVVFVTGERWESGIAETWRDDPAANPGGFVGDAGSHKIDALMYVTGLQPQRLQAVTDNSHSRVPVVTSVTGWLGHGVPLTMAFAGHAHAYQEDLVIHCESADLILRDGNVLIAQEDQLQAVDLPVDESGPASILNPVSGMLRLLDGDCDNPAPFACALPVFDVTAALLESSRSGHVMSPDRNL